jgi:hypothetical protein
VREDSRGGDESTIVVAELIEVVEQRARQPTELLVVHGSKCKEAAIGVLTDPSRGDRK